MFIILVRNDQRSLYMHNVHVTFPVLFLCMPNFNHLIHYWVTVIIMYLPYTLQFLGHDNCERTLIIFQLTDLFETPPILASR